MPDVYACRQHRVYSESTWVFLGRNDDMATSMHVNGEKVQPLLRVRQQAGGKLDSNNMTTAFISQQVYT